MTRFVCLGDSFTEGMVDQLRFDGRHLGWADRVAGGLALAASRAEAGGPRTVSSAAGPGAPEGVEYANLAVRGKLLDQVVTEQLPLALELRPDLVTFQAGLNDILRPGTDVPALLSRYEAAVTELVGSASRVLLFTGRAREGWNSRMAARLGPLFAAFNDNVRSVAERNGCLLVDIEALQMISDNRCWGHDRLHLNEIGHERVAAEVLSTLGITDPEILGGVAGWWHEPLPPAPSQRRLRSTAQDVHWFGVHFAPWIIRRLRGTSSGDGVAPKDAVLRLVTVDAGGPSA